MALSILNRMIVNQGIKIFLIASSLILFQNLCSGTELQSENQKGVVMDSSKKSVKSIDIYRNISTSPSAIKVQFKDTKTGQIVNAIIRNDDFWQFIQQEKGLDFESYVNYMIDKEGEPLEIDLGRFKSALGKRWKGKANLGEKYFSEHITFEVPMTFEELNVNNKAELLNKYFKFDYTNGSGVLKKEYFKRFTNNPAFIALLINLGYQVKWGDIAPVLIVSIQ